MLWDLPNYKGKQQAIALSKSNKRLTKLQRSKRKHTNNKVRDEESTYHTYNQNYRPYGIYTYKGRLYKYNQRTQKYYPTRPGKYKTPPYLRTPPGTPPYKTPPYTPPFTPPPTKKPPGRTRYPTLIPPTTPPPKTPPFVPPTGGTRTTVIKGKELYKRTTGYRTIVLDKRRKEVYRSRPRVTASQAMNEGTNYVDNTRDTDFIVQRVSTSKGRISSYKPKAPLHKIKRTELNYKKQPLMRERKKYRNDKEKNKGNIMKMLANYK